MAKELGRLSSRVVDLLEREGPKSVNELCVDLGITNGSSRSVLVKLHKAGRIERIAKGVYRSNGDSRLPSSG